MNDKDKILSLIRYEGPLYLTDLYRLIGRMPQLKSEFIYGVDPIPHLVQLKKEDQIHSLYPIDGTFRYVVS